MKARTVQNGIFFSRALAKPRARRTALLYTLTPLAGVGEGGRDARTHARVSEAESMNRRLASRKRELGLPAARCALCTIKQLSPDAMSSLKRREVEICWTRTRDACACLSLWHKTDENSEIGALCVSARVEKTRIDLHLFAHALLDLGRVCHSERDTKSSYRTQARVRIEQEAPRGVQL